MSWFIVAIVLAILLLKTRSKLRELRDKQALPPSGNLTDARLDAARQDLIVLRLELIRRLKAGEIDPAFYQQVTEQIDVQWAKRFEETWVDGDFWRQSCQRAWNQLAARGRVPPGPPPWEQLQPPTAEPAPRREQAAPAVTESAAPPSVTTPPAVEIPTPPLPAPATTPSEPPLLSPAIPAEPRPESDYAWQPQPPGALEQALHAFAGWPKALLPKSIARSRRSLPP